MCAQLALQDTAKWIEKNGLKNTDYVYLIKNFAKNHSFINIHKCMILDIFYQLLKRVVVVHIYFNG